MGRQELAGVPKEHENHPIILSQYGNQRGGVCGVRFRPNMKHLVSGGADNLVYLWSMHCRPNLRHPVVRPYRYAGHKGPVYCVAVCPLDTLVASGSRDKTIRLWIPTVEGKSSMIKGHTGPVRSVHFNHDGRWILSSSDDKTVKIWQVSNHKFICALSGHMNWVRSAEFDGTCRQVVSGSDDKTIRLWDIESHRCIIQFSDVLGEVNCVRFHQDNTCIASGNSDHCIQIWDIRSKSLIQHYLANGGAVNSVCFHPGGNYLLSGCEDATLKIWDLREGQSIYTLQGHEGGIKSAEFSPTGDFLASGSLDEHVLLWRTNVDLRGDQPAKIQSSVRKDEVGHALCNACNCLCTSGLELAISNHAEGDGACLDTHGPNTSEKRSPATNELRGSPQQSSPPSKPYTRSKDSAAGDPGIGLEDDRVKNIRINIHKHHPKIEVPRSESFETCDHRFEESCEDEEPVVCDTCKQHESEETKLNSAPSADMKEIRGTLKQICSQLDALTKTIVLFEERLSHSENKMQSLETRIREGKYNHTPSSPSHCHDSSNGPRQ